MALNPSSDDKRVAYSVVENNEFAPGAKAASDAAETGVSPEAASIIGDYSDFGEFNVGADSTWNAYGILPYSWRENKRLFFGYQGLNQDCHNGSGANQFDRDVTFHGPLATIEIALD